MDIRKELFLSAIGCHKQSWLLNKSDKSEKLSLAAQFRMEQGLEIGEKARNAIRGGEIISLVNKQEAFELTLKHLADKNIELLYEATFLCDGYVAKADILQRFDDSWHLIEVKSSTNDKSEFIDDLGYTAMVMKRAGCDIKKASIMLISKEYRLGMGDEELFNITDHTKEVIVKADEFSQRWDAIGDAIRNDSPPEEYLIANCRNCEYFSTQCIGKGVEYPVFDIPRLSKPRLDELSKENIVSVKDIPDDFTLTDKQRLIYELILSGEPIIEESLKETLEEVVWPAYYLDFETVMTAIPLYANTAPYKQITTQFSVHICSGPGKIIDHKEFFGEPREDPRPELVNQLLGSLGEEGSIIVYSSFEKGRLKDLAGLFPEHSQQLNNFIDRIFDLEMVFKNDCFYPKFHGKTSIKKTLPALIPDLTYDDLEVNEGDSAMAAYAKLARNEYSSEDGGNIREQLLRYCELDTFAMVKIHEHLSTML